MGRQGRVLVAYPFLISISGVLALAAQNASEVRPHDLSTPLLIAVAVAGIAVVLARLFSSNWYGAGILSLAVIVLFGWYGYVARLLDSFTWTQVLVESHAAVPLVLTLLVLAAVFVKWRYRGALLSATRPLNAGGGFLVFVFAGVLLVGWHGAEPASSRHRLPGGAAVTARVPAQPPGERPDIYLIILDKYTGSRSLLRNFDFDNSPFEDSLKREGFFVPSSPHSNYVQTHLALAAMLNWHSLDGLPSNEPGGDALRIDDALIEDSRTWTYVHDLGYRFIFFPSAFPGTRQNRNADLQLPQPADMGSAFAMVWLRGTLLLPIAEWWCSLSDCPAGKHLYVPESPSEMDWKFHELAKLPDSVGPKFVFAHLLVPHEPYIYNADCTYREPVWPLTGADMNTAQAKAAYIDQIRCVNSKVLTLVGSLLTRSAKPPIIILQADHGHGRLDRSLGSIESAGREHVSERIDPFAAYYLPGQPAGVVYDSITPINVLPRIFNHYFNAAIALQPDDTYWSTGSQPFLFRRVR